MKQPVIQIRNLVKVIDKRTIIDNLSFDVYPGEVFGFLGPNGAGKTTTIRMLFGLISMTSGEIYINGSSIRHNFEEAAAQIGGIVENPEMYKFLTGYQNLIHYQRMHPGVHRERIDEMVKTVGLESRIHDKVKTYSLGMRQRLGLAQAMLHSPSVLVLDEPTNGLDPQGIREMRDYLRRIARENNVAVFVSSHLLSEMEQMCDRIGIIQDGRLVDIKSIDELLAGKSDKISVIFTATPIIHAKEVLAFFSPGQIPLIKGNKIEVSLSMEEIPQVVERMVNAGIKLYGIDSVSKTLEDRFLELTGGNPDEKID